MQLIKDNMGDYKAIIGEHIFQCLHNEKKECWEIYALALGLGEIAKMYVRSFKTLKLCKSHLLGLETQYDARPKNVTA